MKLPIVLFATVIAESASFLHPYAFSSREKTQSPWSPLCSTANNHNLDSGNESPLPSRRQALSTVLSTTLLSALLASPNTAHATRPVTTASSGALAELPPDAVRSYLQYRTPLQTSADYYLFELRPALGDTARWGEIGQVFQGSNARGGQGQPSAVERNFVNPMRILGLAMPPDTADELRKAQFDFEKAMFKISKATQGVKRDLPVEISKDAAPAALQGWEEGRVALNQFFVTVNEATGLPDELRTIPPLPKNGDVDKQVADYGRSPRKYNELVKKTRLCQNRGGPTLSAAWGQLMVSGYLQDSCGIPDMDLYFFQ